MSVSSSGVFANKNVGSGKTVTLTNTLGGNDLGNYTVTDQATTTADITKKSITLSGITASNKTYDGNNVASASVTGARFNDQVAGDDLSVSSSGVFANKNVGAGKTVTLTNTLGGNDLGNYTVTDQATTTADITKKNVTLASITAASKTYDGSTVASITAGAIATGVGSETLAISGSGLFSDKNADSGKTVTVSDVTALTKSNVVATGGDWANYNLTTTGEMTTTADIVKKDVTLASITAASKTYDGSTVASITAGAISGTVGTETLAVSGSGSFDTKNAGNGKIVTVADVAALTKADGTGAWSNYNLTTTGSKTTTADIAKKNVTLDSLTASNKTYDGNTDATIIELGSSDVFVGDSVTFSQTGAKFADRHVAKNGSGNVIEKTVSVSGIAINGDDAGNYALVHDTATTTAKITPKALTLAAVTDSKTYDGNAVSSGVVTALALESVDTVTATQSFASKDVMGTNASTLQVNSGFKINDSNNGNNYSVSTTIAAGTISQRALTVTANDDAKFVTQADASNFNGVSYSGFAGLEDASVLGGTLNITRTNASTNVGAGTYAGTLEASGLTSNNYSISYAKGNFTIVPANKLLIRTTNISTVYGTAPTYETTAQYLDRNNVIHTLGQSIDGSTYTFSDGAGGSVATVLKPYTVSGSTTVAAGVSTTGNTVVGSYSILDTNPAITGSNFVGSPVYVGNLTVTPKPLTAAMAASSKEYDGGVSATVSGSSAQIVTDDKVSFANTSATFDTKNAGTGKTVSVTGISISGDDAANYALQNTTASTTADVTPKAITLTSGNVSKTYDRGLTYTTKTADLDTLSAQLISGDVVIAATIKFGNKNAGSSNKTVSLDAVTISDGNSGGNYSVTRAGNTTSTITPKAITLTAGSVSKIYDGGTTYTTKTADLNALTAQLISGDGVSAATISYTDKNAASGSKAVTLDAVTLSDGNGGGNYTVTRVGNSTSTITAKNLTAAYTADNKVYDGSTAATVLGSSSDIVSGDMVNFANSSATFDNKNVGAGKAVSVSGIAISGDDAGNYALQNTSASTTANVTAKALTAAYTASNKVYDGSTAATVLGASSDIVSGDMVNFANSSATFDNKNVGTGKAVSVSGIAISGTDAGNYALQNTTASTSADVSKKDASITGATTNVTYNAATQTQDAAMLSGFVASDMSNGTVAATGLATGRNAGTYASNLSAIGADVGNYNVTVTNANLVVGKKSLVLAAGTDSKTYDGTTNSKGTVSAAALQGEDTITASQSFASKDVMGANGSTLLANSNYTINDGNSGNNYSVSTSAASGTITPAPLTFIGTKVADKNYDGTTRASVTAGTISGLVGNETLRIAQTDGEFESSSPGPNKRVNVVYRLANGEHGGLASNYTWAPVISTAQIFGLAKDQRYKPEVPSSSAISRVRYLGFNGMSGAAVSSLFLAPWLSQSSLCTASRLENCICESAEDPMVEFCVAPISNAAK